MLRRFLYPLSRGSTVRGKEIFSPRFLTSNAIRVTELQCTSYGDPKQALTLVKTELDCSHIAPGNALVKLIASTVNPADINFLQGRYGTVRPVLPVVAGNEAVFEVMKLDGSDSSLKESDWVIIKALHHGTWCSHMILPTRDLIKIPKDIGMEAAATLLVNPVTAHLLLTEYVELSEGDSVIINGPTSTVGRALCQFSKARKINCICILREKDMNNENIRSMLKRLGAAYIFAEDDLRNPEKWLNVPKPRLALNCVGGKTTTDMLRVVDENATVVTYGGLSLQPVIVPTGSLIFKNLKFLGFWLSRWRSEPHNNDRLDKIILDIAKLVQEKKFEVPPCEKFTLNDFERAIAAALGPSQGRKIVFVP